MKQMGTQMSNTVRDILREYLTQHGYDGLCGGARGDNCGCDLDDLGPCDASMLDCVAAYKVRRHCDDCKLLSCAANGDPGDGYCYQAEKPGTTEQRIDTKLHACPKCKSTNVKCRGRIWNCEDCGERW